MQLRKELEGQQCNELSIYRGELSDYTLATELKKLSVSFPQLEATFFNVLAERVKANGFTDERLKDSIGFLIDNFTYPKPSIANIISFDKRIKLYDYEEVALLVTKNETRFENFAIIKRNGKTFRIKKTDKEKYNIQNEIL